MITQLDCLSVEGMSCVCVCVCVCVWRDYSYYQQTGTAAAASGSTDLFCVTDWVADSLTRWLADSLLWRQLSSWHTHSELPTPHMKITVVPNSRYVTVNIWWVVSKSSYVWLVHIFSVPQIFLSEYPSDITDRQSPMINFTIELNNNNIFDICGLEQLYEYEWVKVKENRE